MKPDRLTIQKVADMRQPEFDRLMASLAKGSPSMAKIIETARKTMTPPRRPRGEKPATTIRILKRQLANHQHVINQQRLAIADKEKVIAGYDVQLSEAQDTADQISQSAIDRRERHAAELAAARVDAARLAYLEGYFYAKETAPPHRSPIYAAGTPIVSHQSQTYARQRERNPQDLSSGRQATEGARTDDGAAGTSAGFGNQIWRQHRDHQADQERDAVEHVEITEASAAYPWPT